MCFTTFSERYNDRVIETCSLSRQSVEDRGGVVTIPASTARMGGFLHIIDLSADPSLFGEFSEELERECQRKTK